MGYLVILAEKAFERAMGKKHRSRAVFSGNRRLFAVVGEYARNDEFPRRPAKALFPLQPVDAAAPRA